MAAPVKEILVVGKDAVDICLHQVVGDLVPYALLSIAPDGEQALAAARVKPPDVVLADWLLPDMHGCSLLQQLPVTALGCCAILFSTSTDWQAMAAARRHGAQALLHPATATTTLRRQLQQALAGHATFSPTPACLHPATRTEPAALTPRESDVLRALAQGLSNKAISRNLSVSECTVKSHLRALFDKLDVDNRTACVRLAGDRGWL